MSDVLQIVVWNVAHGSAMFARTPTGRTVLMDAGASEEFSPAKYMHANGLRGTDLFILSHGDCDHVRDIRNIWTLVPPRVFYRNRTAPRNLVFPTDPPATEPLKSYDQFDAFYSGPVPSGDEIHVATNWGISIRTFYNDGFVHRFGCLNDYSMVTVLDYGCLKFVFPGDLEGPGWDAMMNNVDFLDSTLSEDQFRVLVAPHHGHDAGVHVEFLEFFKPDLTVISGAYGDPHTANDVYRSASRGLNVIQGQTGSPTVCSVVTTKRNDAVVLEATRTALRITV